MFRIMGRGFKTFVRVHDINSITDIIVAYYIVEAIYFKNEQLKFLSK